MSDQPTQSPGDEPADEPQPVRLSIIIPAHNEANRLPGSLAKMAEFLAGQPYLAEVVVVENGSSDGTAEAAEEFADRFAQLRVLRESRRGKGLAMRRGMLEAKGEYLFLCDADLSMPVEWISHFLPPALTDFDVAIATRVGPGAKVFDEPRHRRIIGRIFNWMVRLTVLPGLRDTQCGFKCFRAEVAREIFSLCRLDGMSLDVEALYAARRRGRRIVQVPIHWYFDPDSRVSLVRDSMRMAWDLLVIRWNGLRGRYSK